MACLVVGVWLNGCVNQQAPEGLSLEVVPTPPGTIGLAAWINEQLVVQLTPPDNRTIYESRLWLLNRDGSSPTELQLPRRPECEAHRVSFEAPERLPDGRLGYILRCGVTQDPFARLNMMAYDVGDHTSIPLRQEPLPSQHVGTGGYSWNPAMTRGITSDGAGFVGEQLYWFTATTTEPFNHSFAAGLMAHWSPDGASIAFVAAPDGLLDGPAGLDAAVNLYLFDPEADHLRALVEGFRYPSGVVWSPNSHWIVMGGTVGRFRQTRGLWLVEVATGTRKLLLEGDYEIADWSPDGRSLLVKLYQGSGSQYTQQLLVLDATSLNLE